MSRLLDPFRRWQRERIELNHDWLGNQFLPALEKWRNVLLGVVEDEGWEETYLPSILADWDTIFPRLVDLLDGAESQLHPPGLRHLERRVGGNPDYDWLITLGSEAWRFRLGLREVIRETRELLELADQRLREVKETFANARSRSGSDEKEALVHMVGGLINAQFSLSAAISRLPRQPGRI